MRAFFESHYARCGQVQSFVPMPMDGRVSNQHFSITTDAGRWLLKQIRDPSALYEGEGMERLGRVADAARALSLAKIGVERVVPTDTGELVVSHGDSAFRVFEFEEGRPYNHTDEDRASAARALREFHGTALEALDDPLRAAIGRFKVPFPLSETRQHLEEIRAFLERGAVPEAAEILRQFEVIERELERTPERPGPRSVRLVHLDYHPDNVIFRTGRTPVIIDLDNMRIDDPNQCVALAVMRFAEQGKLQDSLALWQREYGFDDPSAVVEWMTRIELEKILRIIYRVMKTGAYRHFLRNIAARHEPNLRAVAELRSHAGLARIH